MEPLTCPNGHKRIKAFLDEERGWVEVTCFTCNQTLYYNGA